MFADVKELILFVVMRGFVADICYAFPFFGDWQILESANHRVINLDKNKPIQTESVLGLTRRPGIVPHIPYRSHSVL